MSYKSEAVFVEVESFIAALKSDTGVSDQFLEQARPMIERAFKEVPSQYLSNCLDAIWKTVRSQAETEQHTQKALQLVKELGEAQSGLTEKLAELKKTARCVNEEVAAMVLSLNGRRASA